MKHSGKKRTNYFFLLSLIILATPFNMVLAVNTNAEADNTYHGAQLRRWTVVVSDLQETLRLYRDILGFELGDVRPDKKTSYVYEVFNIDPGIDTSHVTFHAGDKKRIISAVVVPNTTLAKPPSSPYMSAILLNVAGRFDQVVAGLLGAKYDVAPPHVLGTSGMEVAFTDKDGHLHVIYEFPYTGSKYKDMFEKVE